MSDDGDTPAETTDDRFLGGRLLLRQPRRGYRSGQDAVLLAAAVPARAGQSALELGCGAGAAILALGTRVPGLGLAGLELQDGYARLALLNAASNGLVLAVHVGSVEAPPRSLGDATFDHVLMNPPYFDRAASTPARDDGRDLAHGGGAPLAAWLELAARRLGPGGGLTLIQRPERLPEVLAGLPPTMGSTEVLPLAPREGRPAGLILLRARKGGRGPFRLLAPLTLHETGDAHSRIAKVVLTGGSALPWGD